MRLTVLGSGGWIPTSSRQTSCYLITSGTQALVLDAGTGLGTLHINPSLLDGVETVTVVLSHFHLDHVTGLGLVSARGLGDRELTIAGPGSLCYGRPTRSILEEQLLASPLQTASPVAPARWAELGWETLSFAGHEVVTWEQTRHSLPSAGLRVGDRFAYCTDTEFDPETIRRTAGVTTLLHEAWQPVDAERGHTSGDEVGVIAAQAGVARLIITHNHPLPGVPERTAAAAQAQFAAAVCATDGAVLEL
ncbi:MBL fold metallo-hydrolase [Candidatus Mycobacterium methanotrophicum]|uniref:MBL fold metallo-hydrolase n=1 Tax=Candidatus Mycobacterium methanotrophicum TaxID=2943498 RepID=A0ABY4QPM6_9MYCO|nr:MBL fold metallo-hydrolase [Candidatus Mycobacterium methanotrophicum]UQX11910.1 MBL fold metallo-hydrolase [Candidatus Mycobacterium methanotrophicum]